MQPSLFGKQALELWPVRTPAGRLRPTRVRPGWQDHTNTLIGQQQQQQKEGEKKAQCPLASARTGA